MKDWSIMTSFSKLKILSKYKGELRFGPAYVHIKTEPENIFDESLFGDWFYRIENGVYLQKWNSNPIKDGVHIKVNNDLIFYDILENKIKTIESGIKSFFWKIEKSSNNIFTLISNNCDTEKRILINH
jgi:hypothetical protein